VNVWAFLEQVEEGTIPAVVKLFRHVIPGQAAVRQALDVSLVQVDGGVDREGGRLEKKR